MHILDNTQSKTEGYTLWKSPTSWNWNSVDVGPERDLIADISTAVRNVGLQFGLYYSLYEWYNPIYRNTPKTYIKEIMLPQMTELVNTYHPSVLWGDGCLDYPSDFWETPQFLAWLFNESPVCDIIAVNDRWGNDTLWTHGGFLVSEEEWPGPSKFGKRKWEDNRPVGWSYGYNRMENSTWYKEPGFLIPLLIFNVANGGNFLLNVGPTHDGRIDTIMQTNLLAIGAWLKVNGEAIYPTERWRVSNETDHIFYTWNAKNNTLYAITTKFPKGTLTLREPKPTAETQVKMLGLSTPLKWNVVANSMVITVPLLTIDELPCLHAWTFSITHAA